MKKHIIHKSIRTKRKTHTQTLIHHHLHYPDTFTRFTIIVHFFLTKKEEEEEESEQEQKKAVEEEEETYHSFYSYKQTYTTYTHTHAYQ